MKLGILLDRLDGTPGGAEAHTLALAARAVNQGEAVVFATLSGTAPEGFETLRVPAPSGRPARDEAFAADGATMLRAAGCDVVFAIRHALDCDVYLPHGGLVDLARDAKDRAAGGPSLLTRVGRAASRKHAFFQRAEAAMLGGHAGPQVIAVSEWLAGKIRARYPACAHRIEVVVNGVDTQRFDPARHADAGVRLRASWGLEAPLVALLSAHHPVLKGAETAIRALAASPVVALERPLVLVIAGGALPGRLRTLAARLGVAERVHEVGLFDDSAPLYAAADLLLHPTYYDPCSLVCLEALSMGVPIVTTPEGGICEIMGDRAGIVVGAAGDAEAIAAALHGLAEDATRQRASLEARNVALGHEASSRLDAVLDLCRRRG